MQSRKYVEPPPIERSRLARSASASGFRDSRSICGALLVCRAVHPMLADNARQQAVRRYPKEVKAVQYHSGPYTGLQHVTGHIDAVVAA